MESKGKIIKGFKGFNKDLKCHNFQYKVGGEYEEKEAIICKKGFHFCEHPLDVLAYYDLVDSRFAEVEASGDFSKEKGGDTKVCCTKIKIKAEISFQNFILIGVKFILDHIDIKKEQQTMTGYSSAATNTGYRSAATNTGDRSAATNTGDRSAATVTGKDSIACGLGIENRAKGEIGCWLVLAEWKSKNYEWSLHFVKSIYVDGKKIKANVFYELKDGKFIEVKDGRASMARIPGSAILGFG